MVDMTLTNKIRRGEIDINNQSLFFSILIKGLMRHLYDEITVRSIKIPHIIINTGDDLMYLGVKGHDQSKEPIDISNEDYVYNAIPRCMVNPKGINLVPDQLTSPYSWGQFQYEDPETITTFRAEFRRMPLTMSFDLKYYFDSYTDLLESIQQVISKLSFVRTFNITYMGQKITCSYKIPESLEGEYSLDIDGAYSENKYRTMSISIEVESCYPIFNNRSVIQGDHFIRDLHYEVNDDMTYLDENGHDTSDDEDNGHIHNLPGMFKEGDKKLSLERKQVIKQMRE